MYINSVDSERGQQQSKQPTRTQNERTQRKNDESRGKLNLEGLKELWEKTNRMGRDAGCLALRDVVMTILENRYGEEKFDEWLDTEDFEIFA